MSRYTSEFQGIFANEFQFDENRIRRSETWQKEKMRLLLLETKKVEGGASAKAKANAVQGIIQMIEIARKTSASENMKLKNHKKASQGWLRYLTRFALPVLNYQNIITHYNIYIATLVVRKNEKGKLSLYDVVNVKKETETVFEL